MTSASDAILKQACCLLIQCFEKENESLEKGDYFFVHQNLETKKNLLDALHIAFDNVCKTGTKIDFSQTLSSIESVIHKNQSLLQNAVRIHKHLTTAVSKVCLSPKTYTTNGVLPKSQPFLLKCGA